MKNARWKIGFLCVAIISLGVGCGENEPISGNCFIESMDDQSKACLEYSTHEKVREFKQICGLVMTGIWSDGVCDTEGSLGGCETGENKIWLFPAGKYKTKTDVKNFCAAQDIPYLEP